MRFVDCSQFSPVTRGWKGAAPAYYARNAILHFLPLLPVGSRPQAPWTWWSVVAAGKHPNVELSLQEKKFIRFPSAASHFLLPSFHSSLTTVLALIPTIALLLAKEKTNTLLQSTTPFHLLLHLTLTFTFSHTKHLHCPFTQPALG